MCGSEEVNRNKTHFLTSDGKQKHYVLVAREISKGTAKRLKNLTHCKNEYWVIQMIFYEIVFT